MQLPDDWISAVKLKFANGRPDGALLEWNVDRFFEELKDVVQGLKVRNATDFNYAYCNKYLLVPVDQPEGNRIFEASLSYSFICNAFSFHWTSYSSDKRRGWVVSEEDIPPSLQSVKGLLSGFSNERGFIEIEGDWMDIEIAGVELELADVATLGKCLFEDF